MPVQPARRLAVLEAAASLGIRPDDNETEVRRRVVALLASSLREGART